MRIGVIGAGNIGGTLARHLAKLGHHVSIANSRGPESLTALAAEIGATPFPLSTPPKPEKSSSSRSQRRPSPSFRGGCLRTCRAASSWSIPATTIPSFAMAASMRSTGACSTASGSRSSSGVP
jgi:anti-sigma factor RsiW